MNILALDIATKTGWATETAGGVWGLEPNRGESIGMRVVRFKAKVIELIDLEDIDLIVYERPAGRNTRAIMTQSEMIGVLIDLCEDRGINYACYSAGEIKKHATGKGNANKDMMVQHAKDKWKDKTIIDDNHADALWLLDLAKKKLYE